MNSYPTLMDTNINIIKAFQMTWVQLSLGTAEATGHIDVQET